MKGFLRILVCTLLLIISLASCTVENNVNNAVTDDILKIHYIDVGQADCIVIQLPHNKTAIIDGGNKGDFEVIDKYLQSLGIKTIDYLIATHPHEDHIGSLPLLIKSYSVGAVYMPKVTANTKVFEDMLLEIKAKGLRINIAEAGVKLIDMDDIKLSIIAPNNIKYDELNEYSAVVKLIYKSTSFLFTGDAEAISEKEMLNNSYDIKADVLKVGHHGGRSSTTKDFLRKVAPKYAIISVGKDNDYGHPHRETIERLKASGADIYSTDEQGTIVAISDGSIITINKNTAVPSLQYIGNKNSKVFHRRNCKGLPKEDNQIIFTSREAAIKADYKACTKCKP